MSILLRSLSEHDRSREVFRCSFCLSSFYGTRIASLIESDDEVFDRPY